MDAYQGPGAELAPDRGSALSTSPISRVVAMQFSQLFEIARLLVRFNYVARFILNANHSLMRTAVNFVRTSLSADFPEHHPNARV